MIITLLKRVGRAIWDWFDPVCQDPEEVLYGTYNGAIVRLRPVLENGRVVEWQPDPDEAALLDSMAAKPTTAATTAATPPPIPFNPASIPGL